MARMTQAHLDARREDILDASRTLFLSRGFTSVTMQDIATEAGISAGAIYRYYPSKDDLARAFFEKCAGDGPAEMVRQVAPDAPPLARLQLILRAVREMWVEKQCEHIIGEIQTSLAALRQPEDVGTMVNDAREKLYAALIEIVEEGQDSGEIDPQFDPRSLVMAINAFVIGIGLVSLGSGEESLEEHIDQMFDVLNEIFNRLGPAQGAPGTRAAAGAD
jgi:AcrR family transcriptional regulator